MKKIYQAPKMKEIRLSSEAVLVRDSTKDVFSRKHDAMFFLFSLVVLRGRKLF